MMAISSSAGVTAAATTFSLFPVVAMVFVLPKSTLLPTGREQRKLQEVGERAYSERQLRNHDAENEAVEEGMEHEEVKKSQAPARMVVTPLLSPRCDIASGGGRMQGVRSLYGADMDAPHQSYQSPRRYRLITNHPRLGRTFCPPTVHACC